MAWTDEQREEAKELYLNANPTAENTTEIVKDVAETMGQTANGVRMILNKMKDENDVSIYIKAAGAKNPPASTGGNGDGKPKRVSKADSAKALTKALAAQAIELSDEDTAIIGRMTGKATILIKSWVDAIVGEDEEDE